MLFVYSLIYSTMMAGSSYFLFGPPDAVASPKAPMFMSAGNHPDFKQHSR